VLATDFTVFLVCRLVQALVLAGSIVGLAALRDMYATREAAGKMGTIAAAMAVAPMIGPAIGGMLDTVIGWRAIFALYTGMGAACLILVWTDWGETRVHVRRSPREQVAAYRALLGSGLFWAYSMCTAVSVGTFYIFLTGAPFVALATFGLSTTWIGVGLGSITGGFMIGSADHGTIVLTPGPDADDPCGAEPCAIGTMRGGRGVRDRPVASAGAVCRHDLRGPRQRADDPQHECRHDLGPARSCGQCGGAVGGVAAFRRRSVDGPHAAVDGRRCHAPAPSCTDDRGLGRGPCACGAGSPRRRAPTTARMTPFQPLRRMLPGAQI
jgi:hypothetical protein